MMVSVALAVLGCSETRDRIAGDGVHRVGWADDGEPAFHGDALRADGYSFAECRACHGADFSGGDVGIGCSDAPGCHDDGVDDCAGTCHGDLGGPLPRSGAHGLHALLTACTDCHPVPAGLDVGVHIDGTVDVELFGLAAAGGRAPLWEPESRRCADVYCHLGDSPGWEETPVLGCTGCHQQSPTHDRFDRVVDLSSCGGCHGGSPATGHIDGSLLVAVAECDACHGSSPTGAPPVALDGSTDPSIPAVGAHRRHLDGLVPGRIGKVVPCSRCHPVPAELFDDRHLDRSAPVDVDVILGDYDPSTGTCVVSCHFDRDPGPVWTDSSGAELDCAACHDFPPTLTRIGTRHPTTEPSLAACRGCHPFETASHVDGEVDFL